MGGRALMSTDGALFWRAFQAEAEQLAGFVRSGQLRRAFERVEDLLQRHGQDCCFDITMDGEAVLILSPEGDPEEAARIDSLLRERPEIPGWRFFGRRQKKPVQDAFAFVRHIWGRDISDATFDVSGSGEVTVYSKGLAGLEQEKVEGVIATFLDHALGESVAMSRVTGVAGRSTGAGRHAAEAMVKIVTGH